MSSQLGELSAGVVFVCRQPGCLVRYHPSKGYFLDTDDENVLAEEILPRVRCPFDQQPMYLADSLSKSSNYRLWKCPECGTPRSNADFSNELGKKAGA